MLPVSGDIGSGSGAGRTLNLQYLAPLTFGTPPQVVHMRVSASDTVPAVFSCESRDLLPRETADGRPMQDEMKFIDAEIGNSSRFAPPGVGAGA
jgi:hypothetical protein